MEPEYFQAWFGVGVISGLILQLGNAYLCIEDGHQAQQVTQTYVPISNDSFDLMELSQMGGVQGFISKDSVNGEVFHGFEFLLLGKQVEHLGADCSGVGSQEVLLGFLHTPFVLIADRSVAALLMDFLDSLTVVSGEIFALSRILQEEGIMHVSGWVTLRLEECIKVPE